MDHRAYYQGRRAGKLAWLAAQLVLAASNEVEAALAQRELETNGYVAFDAEGLVVPPDRAGGRFLKS